jgi:hypothetical protein
MKISPVTGLRLAPEFPRWQIAYQKPRNPSAAYVVTAANFRKRLRAAFHRSRGHGDASFHFVLGPGRTPGPPPFSGMNSTPATRQPAPNRSSRPSRLSAGKSFFRHFYPVLIDQFKRTEDGHAFGLLLQTVVARRDAMRGGGHRRCQCQSQKQHDRPCSFPQSTAYPAHLSLAQPLRMPQPKLRPKALCAALSAESKGCITREE